MLETTTNKYYLLLLNDRPIFPGGVTTLVISKEEEIHLVEQLAKSNTPFGVVLTRDNGRYDDEKLLEHLYPVGTLCKVNKYVRLPNGSLHTYVSTLSSFHIERVERNGDLILAEVRKKIDEEIKPRFVAPYVRLLKRLLVELVSQSMIFTFTTDLNVANIEDPETLLNITASSMQAPKEFLQSLLEADALKDKYELLIGYLENEKSILIMQNQIRNEIYDEFNRKNQEAVIRQQIATLQKQLSDLSGKGGNEDDGTYNINGLFRGLSAGREQDIKELQEKYKKLKKDIPSEYYETIEKEFNKLSMGEAMSPEYAVSRNYLDTIFSLPYPKKNQKSKYNVKNVRTILDRDHYAMKDVKDRVLEFLASRSLAGDTNGAILCLVGPPGVGKTSIGKSIAEALGRKYFRFSVGGMRDEAEIKGHRRTYVGALPGKIIRGMLEVKEVDPVFLIDEIDKIGSDMRGDPASALLEVLDPEQNSRFRDLYMDLPYDLSRILFIVTANTVETIPQPLLDRMEVIEVRGYTPMEKLNISKKYLFPRLVKKNGLEKYNVLADDDALLSIAEEYSREAGVRNYEKDLDKVLRKLSLKVIEKNTTEDDFHITKTDVEKYLGQPRFDIEDKVQANVSGTSIGLAWTALGGDVLLIEAEAVPGHEEFKITGKLGDVMKESCIIALSAVKHECYLRGLDPSFFTKNSIHVHIPEGAIPKDGPSAGITLATALWSMVTDQVIKEDLAMTGELTLTGKVMPIGGLREKTLAARRNHVKDIIIPEGNKKDLDELDDEVKGDVVFHPVSTLLDVFKIAFPSDKTQRLSKEEADKKLNEYLEKENREVKNAS